MTDSTQWNLPSIEFPPNHVILHVFLSADQSYDVCECEPMRTMVMMTERMMIHHQMRTSQTVTSVGAEENSHSLEQKSIGWMRTVIVQTEGMIMEIEIEID
jgi:hypothetical protein